MSPSSIVRAALGEKVSPIPIWFMRQAGRFLPEYRELRSRHPFVELMSVVGLAAEVTMQPVRRFDLDAAIIFSDILTVLQAMGVPIEFNPGPVLPEFDLKDAAELHGFDPAVVAWQYDAVAEVRARLHPQKALIGFTGGAFTLACYLTGTSRSDFAATRRLMKQDSTGFGDLLQRIADASAQHLIRQAHAGADLLMIFDSWAGVLTAETYKTQVLDTTIEMVKRVKAETGKPVIYFINGMFHLLDHVNALPVDVIGVDHRTPMDLAVKTLGEQVVVQGNLDPTDLFLPQQELGERIDRVLLAGSRAKAHIFNLGHGILPQTPLENVEFLIRRIRSHG